MVVGEMEVQATANAAVINQASGNGWHLYNGDCIEIVASLQNESIGFSGFSPPFASLYTYSNSDRDLGNCLSISQFFDQFTFLVVELFRVLKPGRVVAVHCMELPRLKSKDGFIGTYDFPADIRGCFEGVGFHYDGRVTIWKDPVTAMQRTKSIRLLHKQLTKDSTISSWALPDYVLKFKKPGINLEPVEGELDRFAGDQSMFRSQGRLSIDIWQRYASPVWMDIDPSNTLQYMQAREENDERHICPLQLDVIDRCLQLWSNPGDTVLEPFLGVGSVIYQAILQGRKGVGIELKPSYFNVAVKNCRVAEAKAAEGMLF